MTYYIQIKYAFWKTSGIPWLHGVFETGDRFLWKDLIAFYVLTLLTGWHTEASATSTEAFQHPATPYKTLSKPYLTFQKVSPEQHDIPILSLSEALWIFSFVRLHSSLVLWQCALQCLNRSHYSERKKSSWSNVTSACHVTLVLHSGSAYVPHGWSLPRATDLFSIIRSAPSIQCYVSWPIVQGVMKSSWCLTMALAKHYLGDFTGVMCATGVNINSSRKPH